VARITPCPDSLNLLKLPQFGHQFEPFVILRIKLSLIRLADKQKAGIMTGMKYTITLHQDSNGGFVASAPALPGCVSQGDTREEVLANIREAVELYLEDLKDSGEPFPTSPSHETFEIEIEV